MSKDSGDRSDGIDPGDFDAGEYERRCRAAENRLSDVVVRDVVTRRVEKNGRELQADDIRVLAVIVSEQRSLDPQLGRVVDGVSRSAVKQLFGFDGSGATWYRFNKLEEALLIEQYEASWAHTDGAAPMYAVPTTAGRDLIESLGVLPVLTRDRELSRVVDSLIADYRDVREELIVTVGRQVDIVRTLDEIDSVSEFTFGEDDFKELAETGVQIDMELSLDSGAGGVGRLLEEMDEVEQERMIDRLLSGEDDDADGDGDEDGAGDGTVGGDV